MVSINYVIATHARTNKRREKTDIYSKYVLRYHLQILDFILKKGSLITQITIICPDVKDDSGEYYSKNLIYISNLRQKGIVVELFNVIDEGISYDQYIKCFKKYNEFDYYIIMEDDWAINPYYNDFDKVLVSLYEKTFNNSEGFLDCWSPKSGIFTKNGGFCGRFHSAITVGILSNKTTRVIVSYHTEDNKNKILDQILFSNILINSNISIVDLNRAGLNLQVIFWSTDEGLIQDYTENDVYDQPLFVPIQYFYKNVKYRSMKAKKLTITTITNLENLFSQQDVTIPKQDKKILIRY